MDVKRAERRVNEVLSCEFLSDNPAAFRIVFADSAAGDPGATEAVDYEAADGPAAAAEIIAKIRYINSLERRG